jgi:hypothetical protein
VVQEHGGGRDRASTLETMSLETSHFRGGKVRRTHKKSKEAAIDPNVELRELARLELKRRELWGQLLEVFQQQQELSRETYLKGHTGSLGKT